jgi:HEAT repeat protein
MIAVELSVVSILLCGYALWIFGMLGAALLRGAATRQQQRRAAELQPKIREALIDYLSGAEDSTRIREYLERSRGAVASAMLSFRTTVSGGPRDRLCELALDQALVHDWCQDSRSSNIVRRRAAFLNLGFACSYEPCRRVAGDLLLRGLSDPDAEVRLEACRALVQGGGQEEVESVFEVALSNNPLIRILLTEDLRPHAALLCERAVPEALGSSDGARVLAALDILVAWERALPLRGLFHLLRRDDQKIRMQALRLAPLIELTPEDQASVLDALADPDPHIATVAAQTAGRLRLESALTGLARCLRTGAPDLARIAAAALAEIPRQGRLTLEELSSSANPVTAMAAREALERARQRGLI